MEVEALPRHWSAPALEASGSFSTDEFPRIPPREASRRLGVASARTFFQLEGDGPSAGRDLPSAAIDSRAQQLDVEPTARSDDGWQGRTGTRSRGRLRTALGVRPATADAFNAVETGRRAAVVPWDHDRRPLQDAVLAWERRRRLEPPPAGRLARLVRATVRPHEAEIGAGTAAKRRPSPRRTLEARIAAALPRDDHEADEGSDGRRPTFSVLKTDPGRVSRTSVWRAWEPWRQMEARAFPDPRVAARPPKLRRH
jgi:hypothetical protein